MSFDLIPHELAEHIFVLADPQLANQFPSVCKGLDASNEINLERIWNTLKDLSAEHSPSLKNKWKKLKVDQKVNLSICFMNYIKTATPTGKIHLFFLKQSIIFSIDKKQLTKI